MTYTFRFNPREYEFDSYSNRFMSLILKHIDDPRPLYDAGYFRIEDNSKSYGRYKRIYPTFTQFLNGEYYDVIYSKGTVELNLNEKEVEMFNNLVQELIKDEQTELLTKVLETKGQTNAN